MNPFDLLLPYQRAWVEDASRWKVWLASRQIGKSFAGAAEVALDCQLRPGTHWLLVSAGQRQAQELCTKARQWVQAINLAIATEARDMDGDTFLKEEITLKNGSRITALPANPDTVRGYSANLFLDEFAFHRDAAALWSAVLPSITNPLRGELKVRICSTPNGQGGAGAMFYQIWSGVGEKGDVWSRHHTTIHHAKAAGLEVDIEQLRRGCADADAWRQEFETEFIDSGRVAFPYDLIAKNEDELATMAWPAEHQPEGTLYCGIDVGSLRDPSVCLTLEKLGGRLVVREVLVLENMELADQEALLSPRVQRAARASIDASGIGLDLAQRLRRRHGGKVIAQAITAKWKREAFRSLQAALADGGRLALPADRRFRDDLHAYEVTGAGETASYRAPRTEEGHSDMTSALVHAWDAATAQGTGAFTLEDARAVRTGQRATGWARPRFVPKRL